MKRKPVLWVVEIVAEAGGWLKSYGDKVRVRAYVPREGR